MSKSKQTEKQSRENRIRNNLELLQNSKHYNSEQMGVIIRKSHATYISRRKHPDSLTVEEVCNICNHFQVSVERFLNDTLAVM